MKRLLSLLLVILFFIGCSSLEDKVDVHPQNGSMVYAEVIGETWYCDRNLAGIFGNSGTFFIYDCVEKWKFHEDSIVVIATRYDPTTMQPLDQFRYIADISERDKEFYDDNGHGWRTTTTWWKVYARAYSGCGWTDIYSFCTGPFQMIINDVGSDGSIGLGNFENCFYWLLTAEPTVELDFYSNWRPAAECGYSH